MIVYYFVVALLPLTLLAAIARRRDIEVAVLVALAFSAICLSGLRWASDIDHMEYAEMFVENPTLANFNAISIAPLHGEPGYLLITAIFKSLGLGFVALSAMCAVFAVGTKAWVVSKFTRSGSLVFCLYLCIHFITIEFIQIRWAVAAALVAVAIYFQAQRRLMASLIFLLCATSLHYFSALFIVVCLLAEIRKDGIFYATVTLLAIAGVALVADGFFVPQIFDSNFYVVRRALRYLTDPLSNVGIMSYGKLALFPLTYAILANVYPHVVRDRIVIFLQRIAFASLAATLFLSFIPIMHFRAVVIADLFSLLLIFRMLDLGIRAESRTVISVIFCALYGTWFIYDVGNYIAADRLYEYQSWLWRGGQ
jgi:hypothetical protein